MTLDNIYKNTITFPSNGNIELNFKDNKSETRYLLDIIIDNNIMINNVFSIGTYKNIGTIINNSSNDIGISLDSIKVTLVLSGSHDVQVKIKQGIFSDMKNNVATPNYSIIPIGYSFGFGSLIMTETQNNYYKNTLFSPFNTTVLSDINSLLDPREEIKNLYSPFLHDNDAYPKFAYTSKISSTDVFELKHKNINCLISEASIPNKLFINSNIERIKLEQMVKDSLDLADTSLQNIFVNNKIDPETKNNLAINLNMSDTIKTIKKNNINYYTYLSAVDGIGTIEYENTDFQSKIVNPDTPNDNNKSYFVLYSTGGEYSFEDMDLFFRKENNIKLSQTTTETNDLLYSTSKLKALLFGNSGKVDKFDVATEPVVNSFVKMKINNQGQVYENEPVLLSDLSNLLDSHYEKTGVKQVINTARSTIFFM